MSLFISKVVGKSARLGIWHITETLEALLKLKTFSETDLKALGTFSHEQRKKEWLVARILTEQLTGETNLKIMYDEHNKPSLNGSEKHISLSHSHDLLTVILDEAETGIDIELIKPQVEHIKHKFMSDAELRTLEKENVQEQLTVYWCVKESLYKLYGKKDLAFKENLFVDPFPYAETGIVRGWIKNTVIHKSFTLKYENISSGNDRYMMAYIFNED